MSFTAPITSYDFHIYYTISARDIAINLKTKIFNNFSKEIQQDKLVFKYLKSDSITGPHSLPFIEVDIQCPLVFIKFFSWIQLNNMGLSVLIHPNSGDAFKDHTIHTAWIGDKVEINTDMLKGLQGYPEFGVPTREEIKNGWYEREQSGIMIRLIENNGFMK